MKVSELLNMLGLTGALLGASMSEAADRYEPEFEHYESPSPSAREKWFPAGMARITFKVDSSGAVLDFVIEHSTHASLTEAVKRAVPLWRFKPWTPSAYAPSQISDMRNFIFGQTWESAHQLDWARSRLRGVSCKAFNKAQRERRSQLSMNEVFALNAPELIIDLILEAIESRRLEYYEVVEVMDLFERSKSAAKEACLDRPDKRYVEMLPDKVRRAIRDIPV